MNYRNSSGLALVIAAGLLVSCGKKAAEEPMVRPVRTTVVTASSAAGVTNYTGEIRSRYEADISFQVGGKIASRAVDVGATVRKGTVLAQLDQTDQRVGVDASRAAVTAARAELSRARLDEARYRDLLERGLTTRATYLAQQTAVKTGQSKLDQASADLKLNEQRLGYTTLRADTDGVVTAVMAEAGAVVSAGQKVMSIAQPSELEAVFDVPDSRIESVRGATGVQIALLSSPQAPYPATVREISPSADPNTRTYRVKTSIPVAPASLRLGQNVTVIVSEAAGSSSAAPSLPATALFQKDRSPAVWIVKQDQTLELRPVVVGRYDSDKVVISQGLRSGERVVTAGVHRLAAGERVRLYEGEGK